MWYVDLAWPAGLVLIAVHSYIAGAGTLKSMCICAAVFFQGARMLMGGIQLVYLGQWSTKKEIQRYEF